MKYCSQKLKKKLIYFMIQTTLYVIPGQLFFKTNTILMLIAVLYIYIYIFKLRTGIILKKNLHHYIKKSKTDDITFNLYISLFLSIHCVTMVQIKTMTEKREKKGYTFSHPLSINQGQGPWIFFNMYINLVSLFFFLHVALFLS